MMKKRTMKKMTRCSLATVILLASPSIVSNAEPTTNAPEDAIVAGGHYYKIFNEKLNWNVAKEKCEQMGGHLATITCAEEQVAIDQINKNSSRLWIGGYRDDNNDWNWVTGETWDYTYWGLGEPNNSSNVISNEKCVSVWPSYWNDLNNASGEQSGYICEWDDNTPFIAEERAESSLTFHGNTYKVYNEYLDFDQAKKKCEKLGGHLATITSKEEQNFIEQYVNDKTERLWIGAYRDKYNNWYWVTGEKWKFTNWGDGEPNNSSNVNSNENCVSMWPTKWNDLNNASREQGGFICEWEAKDSSVKNAAPKKSSITSLKNKKNSLVVKNKKASGVSGYIVQCSTSQKFTKKTTATIKLAGKTTVTSKFSKLIKKKKYFLRVRTYKVSNGTKTYSEWSNMKSCKIKK